MGRPGHTRVELFVLADASAEWVIFMGQTSERILQIAQEHASDVLKRRWPNRHIGRPILSIDDCIAGLIEIGALSATVVGMSTKKIALIHWVLSRIESKPRNTQGDDQSFYRSSAWRKLRFSVLAESRGACYACGATAAGGARLHVDHIKPRSKFPELALNPANLQVLCEDCNVGKADGEAVSFT
jgi:hypothetical protein